MKKTSNKRTDLLDIIRGKKSIIEISLESIGNLRITGTSDNPIYWLGSRQVEYEEFSKTFSWLDENLPGVILDWSTDDKLDILIPIPVVSNDLND